MLALRPTIRAHFPRIALAAIVLSLGAVVAACATVIGLDKVQRVDCTDDCGVDGGGLVEAGDGSRMGPPLDSASQDGGAMPCVEGQCDGGYCDLEAGICRSGCAANSDCTVAPNVVCDVANSVCVPCLPTSNTCPQGTFCAPLDGEYTCAQGCTTVADCTMLDGGGGGDGGDAGTTKACCNHVCTNTAVDDNNCNACGNVCPLLGDAGGACCSSACTDVLTSPAACGGCGNACSANNMSTIACGAGVCDGVCNPGFADCNANKLTDGCETNLATSAQHCGACASACSNNNIAVPACAGSVCNGACNAGFADCNNNKLTDGCETNTATNAADCGGCGKVCSASHVPVPACGASVCDGACAAGWGDCNNDKLTDGCETDIDTDVSDCGTCGHVCPGPGATCTNGVCGTCYAPGTITFGFTGGVQSWTVPCGVVTVTIAGDGAQGGANGSGNVAGALGGSASGTLTVTAGQVLEIFVGGAGTGVTGGYNGGSSSGVGGPATAVGGGGGGASDVRTSPYALGDRVLVAGGGGGAGGDRIDTIAPGEGGGGGGGYYGGGAGEGYGGAGGGGGTQAAGGAGGCGMGCIANTYCGAAGTLGSGGAAVLGTTNNQAATQAGGAGGAGGGLTAGAGITGGPCGTNFSGGGGGGGSSYTGGVGGGATALGVRAGNGQVTISW